MVTVHAEADNVEIFSPALLTMFLRTLGNAHVCVLTFVALRGRPV